MMAENAVRMRMRERPLAVPYVRLASGERPGRWRRFRRGPAPSSPGWRRCRGRIVGCRLRVCQNLDYCRGLPKECDRYPPGGGGLRAPPHHLVRECQLPVLGRSAAHDP
jgi:hypothetical protein